MAAVLMTAWRDPAFDTSPRRSTVLHAIREHDNGWREVDAAPLLDETTRTPLDFVSAPDAVRRALWPRGVEALAARPYSAALVAHHAIRVHESSRENPAWGPFFGTLEALRERYLAASACGPDELTADYFFLRMGDLMSLTLCTGWSGPFSDGGYHLRLEGARLIVKPDPFGGTDVPCSVPARRLPNRPFNGPADAASAFAAARPEALALVASGR
jgi:hypothetical protein